VVLRRRTTAPAVIAAVIVGRAAITVCRASADPGGADGFSGTSGPNPTPFTLSRCA
jgi:hypothetical protein